MHIDKVGFLFEHLYVILFCAWAALFFFLQNKTEPRYQYITFQK